jgi:hypothetical protein
MTRQTSSAKCGEPIPSHETLAADGCWWHSEPLWLKPDVSLHSPAMTVIRNLNIGEIERGLLALGGGNHRDNMQVIGQFPRHYLVELSEDDFFNLVFLQVSQLSTISPPGQDRTLRAVATRAISSSGRKLGSNWDLELG